MVGSCHSLRVRVWKLSNYCHYEYCSISYNSSYLYCGRDFPDGKGYLTRADLKAVMKGVSSERVETLLQELDFGQADRIER